jgi:two-component system chemotaxis sensor kinase CheA
MGEMPQPDPALLELFRAELDTHTETLSAGLLSLEKDPNQPKCVEGLMRAAHSIKGAAKIVGFEAAVKVAHLMEDCFVAAQAGEVQLSSDAIDVLLGGVDALVRLAVPTGSTGERPAVEAADLERLLAAISAVKLGQPVPATRQPDSETRAESSEVGTLSAANTAQREPCPEDVEQMPPTGHTKTGSRRGDATLDEFVVEAKEHLSGIINDLVELERSGDSLEAGRIDRIFRAVHSIKGGAGYFGCRVIESLAHTVEEVLERLRGQDPSSISPVLIDTLLAAIDRAMALIDDVAHSNDADIAELLQRLNSSAKSGAGGPPSASAPAFPAAPLPSLITTPGEATPPSAERASSLRVSVSLVDRLMTLAGELVLARNQALRSIDAGAAAMRPVLQKLDAVTSELQGAVTQTRMQPVGNLFARFPRLVRDLTRQLTKQITLETSGTEVELDKSVLEQLSDPLTHLVRNSCDHGIESPEERRQAGKPPGGKITLAARQLGGQICIEIRDDGRGLDSERIRTKAIQSGLRTADDLARASERELFNLILMPGFSTARVLSDVSGRGVGMDVVKTNLDRLGGTLEIDSTSGVGTVFSLRVPLTLAIIPCLVVKSAGRRYCIPQKDLEELVCLHPDLTATRIEAAADQELIRLRDRLLPLVRLGEVFSQPNPLDGARRREIAAKYSADTRSPESACAGTAAGALLAVVRTGSRRFGIIVDEIVKSEEIVVKPMHGSLKPLACFSGATIMGDGEVALILNVEGIAAHGGIRFGEYRDEQSAAIELPRNEGAVSLLFRYGPNEQFAVPLTNIRRLLLIDRAAIERVGPREFVALDGVPTPIVRLDRLLPVSPESGSGPLFLIIPKSDSRRVGVLATAILDTETLTASITRDAFPSDGVIGTTLLRGHTTLVLDLARIAELTETASPPSPLPAPATTLKARILLVEDTEFFRELISGYLKADYEVTTAVNGAEALRMMEIGDFDVVVSDIEMPVMDGWTFAETVRQNVAWTGVPLLALTTLSSGDSRERARRCGFDGYLVKLDRDELLSAVSAMLLIRNHATEGNLQGGQP